MVRIGRRRQCQLDTLPPICSNLFHFVIISDTLSHRSFLFNSLFLLSPNPIANCLCLHFNFYSAFSGTIHLRVLGIYVKPGEGERSPFLAWVEVEHSFFLECLAGLE